MKKFVCVVLAVLLFCVVLAGCTSFFSKGSFAGSFSQGGSSMKAKFSSFNGERGARFSLKQGDKVSVKYELSCEDGTLALTLEDKDGNVLYTNTEDSGTIDITASSDQKYTLRVTGVKAKGSYDISWSGN